MRSCSMKSRLATLLYQAMGILFIFILLLGLRASNITSSQAKVVNRRPLVPTPSPTAPFLSVAATPTPSIPITYHVLTRLNVAYGPLPDEMLDLCVPQAPTTARPGII